MGDEVDNVGEEFGEETRTGFSWEGGEGEEKYPRIVAFWWDNSEREVLRR